MHASIIIFAQDESFLQPEPAGEMQTQDTDKGRPSLWSFDAHREASPLSGLVGAARHLLCLYVLESPRVAMRTSNGVAWTLRALM